MQASCLSKIPCDGGEHVEAGLFIWNKVKQRLFADEGGFS
jgi:hypothetical protein